MKSKCRFGMIQNTHGKIVILGRLKRTEKQSSGGELGLADLGMILMKEGLVAEVIRKVNCSQL